MAAESETKKNPGNTTNHEIRWTNELLSEILNEMAKGTSLKVLAKEHESSTGGILHALERAGMMNQYAQAMSRRAGVLAAEILDVADDSSIDPNDKRIRVDTRKWYLSKVLPKIYGDRLNVDHTVRRLEDVIREIDCDPRPKQLPGPVDNLEIEPVDK